VGVNPESRASRESQVTQQLFSRRVLYADPVVDITDELVERMNNAYKSGP
jgi:hypothetical protein